MSWKGTKYPNGYMVDVGWPAASAVGRTIRRTRRATGYGGTKRRSGNYRRAGAYERARRALLRPSLRANVYDKNNDVALSFNFTSTMQASAGFATGALNVSIAENTTSGSRIGRRIAIGSVDLQCYINGGANASFSQDVVHVYLILDKQANGAFPVGTDIWSSVGAGQQLRNLDNTYRFKVLKHWIIRLVANAWNTTGAQYSSSYVNFHKNVQFKKPIVIDYNSTAGAITEIKSNNLIMAYGSVTAIAGLSGYARVRYTDN